MVNYKLKKATNKDLDIVIKYKLDTIIPYCKNILNEEYLRIKNYVEENVSLNIYKYLLIIVDKEIIGCLLSYDYEDGKLLDEIYIDSEKRSLGIGSSIINNILKKEKIVYLWVYKSNKKAIKLYKKLGFVEEEKTDTRLFMKYTSKH